jgi:hypothetical protein
MEGVAHAKVAGDLIAQREALGDGVIGLTLPLNIVRCDARQHGRRNQRALDGESIEGERWRKAFASSKNTAR